MNRGQFIAILVGLVGVIGVVVALNSGSNEPAQASTASEGAVAQTNDSSDVGDNPDSLADPNADSTADEKAPVEPTANAPENLGPAMDLVDLDGWLQTDATALSDFDGQVKILQFWTFSCHNCTATIPYLQDIYATYEPQGLEIIGVHAPEFDFERDPAAVQEAAERLGVTWPIALDTDKLNFRAWQDRRFWPRTFVIDANGDVRFNHIGEGKYDELEATVAYLIENGGS